MNDIRKSRKYAGEIKNGLIKNPFATKDGLPSLKILAKFEDKENFKIVVESMRYVISRQKGYKLFRKEPLALIEVLCMAADYGGDKVSYNAFQAQRGLKTRRLSIRRTQKFFQKIYGSHFFVKK